MTSRNSSTYLACLSIIIDRLVNIIWGLCEEVTTSERRVDDEPQLIYLLGLLISHNRSTYEHNMGVMRGGDNQREETRSFPFSLSRGRVEVTRDIMRHVWRRRRRCKFFPRKKIDVESDYKKFRNFYSKN